MSLNSKKNWNLQHFLSGWMLAKKIAVSNMDIKIKPNEGIDAEQFGEVLYIKNADAMLIENVLEVR